jgi:MerR family transcriptional regulator, thiopeptide resistance regulator
MVVAPPRSALAPDAASGSSFLHMEPVEKRWRIGELAEEAGLTVRTLHHFEQVGAVRASERSEAGHRLFTQADVRRLYEVLSLRELGIPLREIAAKLDSPDGDLASMLRRHRAHVDEQLEVITGLRARLDRLDAALGTTLDVSSEEILEVIRLMNMHDKYYSPEQLETLAKRREELGGDEGMKAAEKQWADLIAAVDAERQKGTDPSDPRVQELAQQWRDLIAAFTGGDPEMHRSLQNMYEQEGTEAASRGSLQPEVMGYMNRAMEAG